MDPVEPPSPALARRRVVVDGAPPVRARIFAAGSPYLRVVQEPTAPARPAATGSRSLLDRHGDRVAARPAPARLALRITEPE